MTAAEVRATYYAVDGSELPIVLVMLLGAGTHLLVRDEPECIVTVSPLTFGRARINVGRTYLSYENGW